MTYDELYTFVTGLLANYQMDTTLFNTFLGIAQRRIEGARPWMILRKVDSTQTVSAADTFTTAKALPTDFRRWYNFERSIVLYNGSSAFPLTQVPGDAALLYKDALGKFYADYAAGSFYVCGPVQGSYTAYQYYVGAAPAVSSTQQWIFPSEYHPMLGFFIAVFWKRGVDYDMINNQQSDEHVETINALMLDMTAWDSDLQNATTRGLDPFGFDNIANGNLFPVN